MAAVGKGAGAVIGVQADVLAGSGQAQRQLAASLNERQWILLGLLAASDGPLRASLLFAQAALLVRPSANAVAVLAWDARKLDVLGLVRHEHDARGCMALRITMSGRRLNRLGLRQTPRGPHARSRQPPVPAVTALCALLPSLLSCASVDPPAAPRYRQLPPPLDASQRWSGGVPVWSLCRSADCDKPTPKTPAVPAQEAGRAVLGAGTPVPAVLSRGAAAVSASGGPLDPVAARPVASVVDGAVDSAREAAPRQSAASEQMRFAAYSVYFPFGRATVAAADDPLVQEAAVLARDSSGLVHVVGMTDAIGPHAVNEALAGHRASEVKARLIAAGVDAARVCVQTDTSASVPPPSFSTRRTSVSGNAQYRRVDIVVHWNEEASWRVGSAAAASLQRS